MPIISGNGYISKMGHSRYYMFLVIDGQKVRRPTGTEDADEAAEKLEEWKAQVKVGVVGGDTHLRFETIRDNYLASGKHVQESVLRDLNEFFKSAYVSGITPTKIKAFRAWRESRERVLEYKEETFQKEFALRQLKAQNGSRKPLTPAKITELKAEARKWVEDGVKATTNRRLTVLRAMFNHAAKEELIKAADIPASFCLWQDVDNVKTNKFTEEQFKSLLRELPPNLHPVLHAYQNLGMRSNQLKSLTLNMVDDNFNLVVPGEFTKNGEPFPLPASVDLAAYRIAQEALTNVIRHAHAMAVRVLVVYGPDELQIRIEDDGGGPQTEGEESRGNGLSGMRERAAALGGKLDAGPRAGGGFQVLARLPLRLPADHLR